MYMSSDEFSKATQQFRLEKFEVIQRSEGTMGKNGPVELQFCENEATINIHIEQDFLRTITLTSDASVPFSRFMHCFQVVEQMLMIFEGRFYHIEKINCDGCSNEYDSKTISQEYLDRRLPFYKSSNICKFYGMELLDFYKFISTDSLQKWALLLDELDILHPVILYCLAETGIPVDTKCAHLIESFEPMVELISKHDSWFPSLKPGDKGTTLKMCIDAIISRYGKDLFGQEYSQDKEKFLQMLVDNRNRIMHIKSKQNKKYFYGLHCSLCIAKISLLYRHIILSFLGVDYLCYEENLKCAIGKFISRFPGMPSSLI